MNRIMISTPTISDSRFKLPTLASAGINPLPMALKLSSFTIIVPVFSVTRSSAPRKISMPASEATKEGMPICATRNPLNKPTTIPITRMIGIVR
ncbi:hypothetical protein D3C80_1577790 [compost metagenome]